MKFSKKNLAIALSLSFTSIFSSFYSDHAKADDNQEIEFCLHNVGAYVAALDLWDNPDPGSWSMNAIPEWVDVNQKHCKTIKTAPKEDAWAVGGGWNSVILQVGAGKHQECPWQYDDWDKYKKITFKSSGNTISEGVCHVESKKAR